MPIVPAAREFLKRNEWSSLEGIRLRSEVHARESYTPDLVLVNGKRHAALIMDVKRSLASYQERRLNALRQRMMSVALIAADWLYVECKAPAVSEVGIAVVDGADEASDHTKGIFGLSELGHLLEVAGAGEALAYLRTMFAARVHEELERECRDVLARITAQRRSAQADQGREGCPSAEEAEEHPDPVVIDLATSGAAMATRPDARVRVGFARARAGP